MRVLMLGWEYPPHISGGLGTACEGLTKALSRQDVQMLFVVPRMSGDEDTPHMEMTDVTKALSSSPAESSPSAAADPMEVHSVPAFLKPYWDEDDYLEAIEAETGNVFSAADGGTRAARANYGSNIFEEVAYFTSHITDAAKDFDFDLVHAHDWMTFPAGVAVARRAGKPLVAHVHSLEFDRSGVAGNERISSIESLGVREARAVIAVSHYTKSIICREHGVTPEKVHVVHNGVYPREAVAHYKEDKKPDEKRVLFLGRVTFQKGPDYFVEAAARVLPHVPGAVFVLAGTGDMLDRLKARVADLGFEKNFRFPGFVKGPQLEKAFSTADLYIMPSVSEPFGISALEAISFDTPALISRQSGVSEVIGHTMKFDFWDVDRLADLIINALQHDELRNDMISMAKMELRRLRWDAAAERTVEVYKNLLGEER